MLLFHDAFAADADMAKMIMLLPLQSMMLMLMAALRCAMLIKMLLMPFSRRAALRCHYYRASMALIMRYAADAADADAAVIIFAR